MHKEFWRHQAWWHRFNSSSIMTVIEDTYIPIHVTRTLECEYSVCLICAALDEPTLILMQRPYLHDVEH